MLCLFASPACGLPYEINTDGIERKMWCKCSTFNCNCAYRLHCRTPPRKVLSWLGSEAKPEVCREGASYSGSCFCYKSCACNTTEVESSERVYGGKAMHLNICEQTRDAQSQPRRPSLAHITTGGAPTKPFFAN